MAAVLAATPFVLAVTMLIVGLWLCLTEDVRVGGRRPGRVKAGVAGGALVAYIPLYLLAYFLLHDRLEPAYMQAVLWALLVLCNLVALVLVFRVPKSQRTPSRRPVPAAGVRENPFGDDAPGPADEGPGGGDPDNPFNFSR